jgi:hypothetical protein
MNEQLDQQAIQQVAQKIGPQVLQQAVDKAVSQIDMSQVSPEQLTPLIAALEETLNNPAAYPHMVKALIDAGIADPGDLPPDFDPTIVVIMLIVLKKLQGNAAGQSQNEMQQPQQNFARGGLVQMANELQGAGRNGDSILAHINPMEAAALKRMGGSGAINPNTGLMEFGLFGSFFKAMTTVFKSVVGVAKDIGQTLGPIAPIALAIAAPWAIPALGASLGMGAISAGALYGAGTSALTGGNVLQGAALGGLSGGLGNSVGEVANKSLGLSLGTAGQQMLGNTLVGAGTAALTGGSPLQGAVGAATGTALGNSISGFGIPGSAMGRGLSNAGSTLGNMASAGIPLKQSLIGGGLSGLVQGLSPAPGSISSEKTQYGLDKQSNLPMDKVGALGTGVSAPTDFLKTPELQTATSQPNPLYSLSNPNSLPPSVMASQSMGSPSSSDSGFGLNLKTLGTASAITGLLGAGKAPQQMPQQIQGLQQTNPALYEYMNRPGITWDWDKISADANQSGMPLDQYVSNNWNKLSGGDYNKPVNLARGGALTQAFTGGGAGSGRSDNIRANLSPNEYVMDAETVSMLGDGSPQEGAKRLDEMRQKIRKHKGKALSRGKFSPNAKSPLSYIGGNS